MTDVECIVRESTSSSKAKPLSKKRRRVVNLLLVIALLVTTIGFIADWYSTITYPGSDLRSRVVGARLMLNNIDPYIFKWEPSLSERFYDPLDIPPKLVSRLSVPPTALAWHAPIAPLSYLQQKIVWLLVQWAAFAGTVWFFIKTSHSKASTSLMLGISFFLPTACSGDFM